MSNKKGAGRMDFNARRPQAARMQPVVRKAGMRSVKKPKGGR